MAEDEDYYEDPEFDLDDAEEPEEEEWDDEPEFITLEFDDGDSERCEVMSIFPCDGKEYVALASENDPDSIYIYGYATYSDGSFSIEDIDDDEFERASAELENYIE
ncbi:MAG: DUF1292 domain-containing protein [Tractidigestivibacter sp.]|jgi:hypothetical protein|uniref:DUF1292 domain-containing protein n=1 Tax=Tractidigestivibacter sp. TaxID=2847320 RepID=UPI003D9053D9